LWRLSIILSPRHILLRSGERTRIWDSGGNGETVTLLHGLANSLEIWERVQPLLADRFRVIAFDWPGFGEASRPDAAYDGSFFVDSLATLLDMLDIESTHLIGYSMGASAILHFSERSMARIDRAVLAAPGGFGRRVHPLMLLPALPMVGAYLGRPTPYNNRMTLRLAIHDPANLTPLLEARTNRHAAIEGSECSFHRALVAGVGLLGARGVAHMKDLARAFARPALILWGEDDRVFPPRNAVRAADLLPASQLTMIAQCGHYPQWEQPEVFAERVKAFLA